MEFARPVPPSGNMEVLGKQFWLGTGRAGMMVTFWASTEVIHLTIAGARVKSVRSHLSAADLARARRQRRPARGAAALPRGRARRRDRGRPRGQQGRATSAWAAATCIAAEILGGMLVSIRIEQNTLMFFDPATRVLLRTRPSPLTWDQARLLRGPARPGRRRGPAGSRSPSSGWPATPA